MKNLDKNIFTQLVGISDSGLYALINDKDGLVYICHSVNMLSSLNRHIETLRMGAHECKDLQRDFNNLEFKFLETEKDGTYLRLKCEKWKRDFISRGYKLYKQKTAIKLRLVTRIETEGDHPYKVIVALVTRNYNNTIVGIFNTRAKAQEFISINYPDPIIQDIIYATNRLTREYLEKKSL